MNKASTRILPVYITVLFAVCAIILIGNAASLFRNLQSLKTTNSLVEQSWRVTDRLQYINVLIMDAESATRGYFMTGKQAYLGPLKTAHEQIDKELDVMHALVHDNPGQFKNLTQLRDLISKKLARLDTSVTTYHDGGLPKLLEQAQAGAGKETMDEIRLLVVIMAQEEKELQSARSTRFYAEYQRAVGLGMAINAIAILVLILFYVLIRRNFYKRLAVEDALQTSNENLEQTVNARTEQLSVLSRHLISVAEEEKARLARELHDELGANLTAITMDLANVTDKLKGSDPALVRQLHRARDTLLDTIDLKRRIIENLRPSMLNSLGLSASVKSHCDEFTRLTGIPCTADIPESLDDIDPARSIALYRIAQESMTNIIKYAQANNVQISLRRESAGLRLRIVDDGVGVAADAIDKPMSHGLLGMRERSLLLGGTFSVTRGDQERGTIVDAFIPIEPA